MTIGVLDNKKSLNKDLKHSKVLDVLKRQKKERIEVKTTDLKQFLIDNRGKAEVFKFEYTDRFGKEQTTEKRLFTNGGYVCYYKKGSNRGGYILDFSQYKDLKVTAIMKSGFNSNIDSKTLKRLETWKKLSKFRDLKFHPNLVGNRFYNACQSIPKNYDTWINDQEGKAFKDREYKGLYDYGVTSGCDLDGKVIGEKRLISIFGERVINTLKESLENKQSFSAFGKGSYDYTLDLRPYGDNGIMHLTLSEEFRGMGNGHYYAGTDYNNFIYVERD